MPKNKGKGGKNRRRGKNENDVLKRELIKKDDVNQAYAQVQKMLGNGRLMAFCFDGKQRLCHIRGKLRKKVWINTGDIILVGLRDYQDDKADVILKYTADEARVLKNEGHLPENAKLNEGDEGQGDEIEFADTGSGFESDEDVAAQDRMYEISDSSSEEDEETDEDSDIEVEQKRNAQKPKPAAQPAKATNKGKQVEEVEDDEDSDEDEESEEEDNNKFVRARMGMESKPGARDRYGKANKGKKHK